MAPEQFGGLIHNATGRYGLLEFRERERDKGVVVIIGDAHAAEKYRGIFPEGTSIHTYSLEEAEAQLDVMPEVILLDCGFSVEKGLAVLKSVKSRFPVVPVIYLTDLSTEELAVSAFRAGAREYLRKPVNVNELGDIVERMLTIRSGAREKRVPLHPGRNGAERRPIDEASMKRPVNIIRTLAFIERNLKDEITLDRLAEEAHLSKFHFCRWFKCHMGVSPKKFVNQMRVERAKQLLITDDLSVSMIAAEVGFNDLSNFERQFKQHTGSTPTAFKVTGKSAENGAGNDHASVTRFRMHRE